MATIAATYRRHFGWAGVALLCWLAFAAITCDVARGAETVAVANGVCVTSAGRCRPQDEVWLVSTRDIECVKCGHAPPLRVCVCDGKGGWRNADVESLSKAIGVGRARIWVHGYKIDAKEALTVGAVARRQLISEDEPPMRFVIWSWPAEKTSIRPLADIRDKACRTVTDAYCLAWLLAQFDPRAEVSIAGYSYGVRIITGGLHFVGGGSLAGLRLTEEPCHSEAAMEAFRGYRSVLYAAAIDHDAFAVGGFNDRALAPSEAMLSVYTSSDSVLKWFHVAAGDRNRQALGYVGIAAAPLHPDSEKKFAQMDVADLIGGEHDWRAYLGNATITAASRDALAHSPAEKPVAR